MNVCKPKEDDILVFSRTNDSFRFIPVAKVRRVTSLQSELDRASPVGR
ncbi:portal vertex protein [Klebsiella phage vB_Kpn_3]|nr:portal vertex protein [Klebsiella phage vB_Kpn_3]